MVPGVLTSLAELESELGKARRTVSRDARRARDLSIGRPKALTDEKVALAGRMHDSSESATTISTILWCQQGHYLSRVGRRVNQVYVAPESNLIASSCNSHLAYTGDRPDVLIH
ncbi:hypothetical protein A5664_11495 [Mycolicibacterium fortuitum]|nr:hypothetical protein A5664_11495 [Mycolicibacterium fortuitum]